MNSTADQTAGAVGKAAADEPADAFAKIKHCLDQLTDGQVWWRPKPSLNSIGNLILHLCGNLRQWVVCGVGGATDNRDRPSEFSERGPISKADLLRTLAETKAGGRFDVRTILDCSGNTGSLAFKIKTSPLPNAH